MSPQPGHGDDDAVGLGEGDEDEEAVTDDEAESEGVAVDDAVADSVAATDALAVGETLWHGTSQAPVRHSHACTQPTARQRLSHAEPGPPSSARPPGAPAERGAGLTPAAASSARRVRYGLPSHV